MDSDIYTSIIIPVLNSRNTICECLESLLNLEYSKSKYEIIVVDNGSTDGTIDLVKKYPVRLIFENKIGSYAARNKGIMNSKGNILVFTDADCIAKKDWLKIMINGFEKPMVGCVAGEILSYEGNTLLERYAMKKKFLSQTYTLNWEIPFPQTANVAYRKRVFNEIGYFDGNMISGGDADIAWRMQINTKYKLNFIPDAIVLHKHRTTFKGLFKQFLKYGIGRVAIYKKYRGIVKIDYHETLELDKLALFSLIRFFIRYSKSLNKNYDELYIFEPLIDFIVRAGFRMGLVVGSLKYRTFYV